MRWRQDRTWTCVLHQSLEDLCMLSPFELPASLNIWWWKRKPFAFLPLLCSLYAPLASLKEKCSSFVATQKHAERGLAYNCASFSRVAASTMLSATLLHLYYFVSISQRSFVTEEPSPRLDFLMVRPLADRGKAYTVHLIGSARRSRSGLSVFSCLGGWFVKDKTCILILSQCRI